MRILLTAALVVVVSGDNACAKFSDNSTGADSTHALTDLSRALRAQLEVKSYRARMTLSNSNGIDSTREIEFVAPDRFHMIGEDGETIVIDSTTYMKSLNGQWQKFPVDLSATLSTLRDPKSLEELGKSVDVKFIGREILDGTPTLIYQTAPSKESDLLNTSRTWVAAKDDLPRKREVVSEFKSVKSKTTIIYYDYNADLKIDPPI